MKLIAIAIMSLYLTSCIDVTLNSQPPKAWLIEWERCYHDVTCEVDDIRPWYGTRPTDGTGVRVSK